MTQPLYTTRKANNADYNFIISSWLRSVRCSEAFGPIDDEIFFKEYRPIVEHLLATGKAMVACDRADDSLLLGFIVYELSPTTLHFAYVKQVFRKMGIFTRLYNDTFLTGERVVVTHWNENAKRVMRNKNYTYNPFAIYAQD